MPAGNEAALVGKIQNIKDSITQIEAEATPVLAMIGKGSAVTNSLFSSIAESLDNVPSTGVMDGAAATNPETTEQVEIFGCVQHFRREWGVTKRRALTAAAGQGRNTAGHQRMLAITYLNRIMEQVILSNQNCTPQTGGTPWLTRGMFSGLSSTTQGGTIPVPASQRPSTANNYTSTLASFDELAVTTMLSSMFSEKKSALDLMGACGRDLKAAFDTFTNYQPASITGNTRILWNGGKADKFTKVVRTIETSFGTINLFISEFLYRDLTTGEPTSGYSRKSGLFFDPSLWELRFMQPISNTNLPEDGSGPKGFIDCFMGLGQLTGKGQGMALIAS